MKWDDIISVSGKPGLYVLRGQSKSGVLGESLTDRKKVLASFFQVSSLNDIAVFTLDDEVRLPEVITKMYRSEQNGTPVPDKKSDKEKLKAFFKNLIPDYDEDKFFLSHMKKIVGWYHILKQANLLDELTGKK